MKRDKSGRFVKSKSKRGGKTVKQVGRILSQNELKAANDKLVKAFSDYDQKEKELEKKHRIMMLNHIRNTRRQLGIRSKTKLKGLTANEMRYVNSW